MPALALRIVKFIEMFAKFGPVAAEVYENARAIFRMLFAGGMLTAAQQSTLMTWADEHEADTLAGKIHPALQVEPDPETPTPPTDPA